MKQLTDQQVVALSLIAGGHTYAEAAQVMNIHANTFSRYLTDAYTRLGARHAAHAVHLARNAGLLGGDGPRTVYQVTCLRCHHTGGLADEAHTVLAQAGAPCPS